ncbi:MAG: hypothetical protein KF705_12655 [Phycisphaeraceae bacterium]|nr:hypothetical protein [Phycisphaeraceae bacterium]
MTNQRGILCHSLIALIAGTALADDGKQWLDPRGDASLRRMDFGANGSIGPFANLPDILSLTVGAWEPASPATNLYVGEYDDDGEFFRLDLVLAGVINPPGELGILDVYDPFEFGPSPIYGYVEFDVDNDINTGGELPSVAAMRVLANIARYGGVPQGEIGERTLKQGSGLDFDFATPPFYERSGADFSLAFCGCTPVTVISEDGNQDGTFDAGETWVVQGRFFERFGAFNSASSMFGGSGFGAWNPLVKLRFSHDIASDTTTITLVFPLTQQGAGLMAGAAPQPFDFNVGNQTSVAEAIHELVNQSTSITGAVRTLSVGWRGKSVSDGLDPESWRAMAIVGTAYESPDDALFVWTDAGFDVIPGDFNGNGSVDQNDETELLDYIAAKDGGPDDADSTVNGVVVLDGFGLNFSIYDTNYDGTVSSADLNPSGHPADVNGDGMVDILDLLDFFGAFSACEGQAGPCFVGNVNADFNRDLIVDILDLLDFLQAFNE